MNRNNFSNIFDDNHNTFKDIFNINTSSNFPPYNIWKDANGNYGLDMAVAGFEKNDISIEFDGRYLLVIGENKSKEQIPEKIEYIKHGIAARSFKSNFDVRGSFHLGAAKLKNGILSIFLVNKKIRNEITIIEE